MSQPDLSGRVALVVGAGGGIGAATAIALANQGAHVLLGARQPGLLARSRQDFPQDARIGEVLIDLEAPLTIDRAAIDIEKQWGGLDILVAAGGTFGEIAPVHELDPDTWRQALEINVTGNLSLIRAFHPLMINRPAARAIFVGSGAARAPRATWAPYCATKAALELLIRSYAMENAGSNLRALLVNPGAVATKMRAELFPDEDPASVTAPADIAELILDQMSDAPVEDPIIWYGDWSRARAAKAT